MATGLSLATKGMLTKQKVNITRGGYVIEEVERRLPVINIINVSNRVINKFDNINIDVKIK